RLHLSRQSPTTRGGERAPPQRASTRRSVLEQPLQSGRFEARRTVYSVALLIFLRVHSEVRRPETIATDREGNESGSAGPLRRLRAGPEADLVCYIAAPLAASWQSALCTCGFWAKPPCRRCAMSGPRCVGTPAAAGSTMRLPEIDQFADSHSA